MRFSFLTSLSAVALFGSQLYSVSAQQCSYSDTEGLRLSVSDTTTAMFQDFEDGCGDNCKMSVTPFQTVSVRRFTDFTQLKTSVNFVDRYTSTCQESSSSICYLNSTQTINVPANQILGTPVGESVVIDIEKPVCYPNSCEERQFEDLNVNDKQCQLAVAAGESCVVVASATCPQNRVTTGDDFMCASDNPGPFTQLQLTKNALYALMDGQCADASATGSNRFCDVTTNPSVSTQKHSFTNFIGTSSSYISFQEDCAFSGGSVCALTFNLKFTPFSDTISVVSFEYDYTDYPICIPKGCTDNDSLATEYIIEDLAGTVSGISLCDPNTGSCEYSVSNMMCFPDPVKEIETPIVEVEDSSTSVDKNENEEANVDDVKESKEVEESSSEKRKASSKVFIFAASIGFFAVQQ